MENQFNNHNDKDIQILDLERAVKGSDNKLRSFFESSSVIHLLIDTNLNLIDFNRAAQYFIQKYHKIIVYYGMKITDCIHPLHLIGFLDCYAKAIAGIPSRMERSFSYGKEKIIWFLAYEPATDSESTVIGMSFNAVDITDKVRSDAKISSQHHCLNEIAHIQSHNLRRPVSNITGLMQLFRADGYVSTKEALQMLEKAVIDLNDQLNDIARFAK